MDRMLSEIAPYLPQRSFSALDCLTDAEQADLREIRIKAGCPMLLCGGGGRRIFPNTVSTVEEIESTFRKICASSAYTHRNEICSGFVTVPGGHRVGLLGTAVLGEDRRVEGMRDIYGLSFRIARDYTVSVEPILSRIGSSGQIKNLLLAGPPCSGKTTVLRGLARALSCTVPVSVIDEREELFPLNRPVPVGCDVLRGYPKAVGILQALRTLSPRVIVCDEIGTAAEVSAMMDGLRSGVSVIVSAHAYCAQEVFARPPVRELFLAGGIDFVAFLDPQRVGTVCKWKEREGLFHEMGFADAGVSPLFGVWSGVRA